MTARAKVNDGEVARLQVHQDVLVLDVPDGEDEGGKVNEDECEYGEDCLCTTFLSLKLVTARSTCHRL